MKNIIVLSDGTGNSAAALAKTNVWRLYQTLDLAPPVPVEPGEPEAAPPHAATPQIAAYDNGVGTSSFRPLAILGGVFGWGLKRNVLHLYRFLCLNYQPGDRIHAFGFSRGAFTVRTLVALVCTQGLIAFTTEAEFQRASRDAYSRYRKALPNTTGSFLVKMLRGVRDICLRLTGQAGATPRYLAAPNETPVHFVGVWDTVAAYGLPIAELTSGIDRVVWPLSMPNYRLHPNVGTARHALSLDDERDAFQPLLWDEAHEAELATADPSKAERLKQVWFAGMHADVGGGYADDGAAMQALVWMLREAEQAGLRFIPSKMARWRAALDRSAPLHDSRRGLAGYYRYAPRRIETWLRSQERRPNLMRNPSRDQRAELLDVTVHQSVIERIANGAEHYAPIVLPRSFRVEDAPADADRTVITAFAGQPRQALEDVWNDVWYKRVNYFLLVAISAALAAFPLFPFAYEDGWDNAPLSFLSPVILAAGGFVPSFLQPWIQSFARGPMWFALLIALIAFLLMRGGALQARIRDRMHGLWTGRSGQTIQPGGLTRLVNRVIQPIRTADWYQILFGRLKWSVLPLGFGYAILALMVIVPVWAIQVVQLSKAEATGGIIDLKPPGLPTATFSTKDPYWDAGQSVQTGRRYRVSMTLTSPWSDGGLPGRTPEGFWTNDFPFWMRWAVLIRRSSEGRWFQPFVTIIPDNGQPRLSLPLTMRRVGPTGGNVFEGTFEAPRTGRVRLWVNDAVIGAFGLTGYFYNNNEGTAQVTFAEESWTDQRPR